MAVVEKCLLLGEYAVPASTSNRRGPRTQVPECPEGFKYQIEVQGRRVGGSTGNDCALTVRKFWHAGSWTSGAETVLATFDIQNSSANVWFRNVYDHDRGDPGRWPFWQAQITTDSTAVYDVEVWVYVVPE